MNPVLASVRARPELMAPARDPTCLRAALDAGADAVYFGTEGCNMRALRSAIPRSELGSMAAACHAAGAQAYLTLNAMVMPQEMDLVDSLIEEAAAAQIDAIIASDPAVLLAAQAAGLATILSTQASTANPRAARFWQQHAGVFRVVLARECSLEDIRSLRQSLGPSLQLEVFVHGAMCMAVSGRCLISQITAGCSANRGACQQPCRRSYHMTDSEDPQRSLELTSDQVLSAQDLCSLDILDQVLDCGVDSLKIEGRMRSPDYVATVTRSYRRAIDCWLEHRHQEDFPQRYQALVNEERPQLERVFHRGLSTGFLFGRPGVEAWAQGSDNQASVHLTFVGQVLRYYPRVQVAEIHVQACSIAQGEELVIQGPQTGCHHCRAESLQIDHQPVTEVSQGSRVGIQVPVPVRPQDQVFVIRSKNP